MSREFLDYVEDILDAMEKPVASFPIRQSIPLCIHTATNHT